MNKTVVCIISDWSGGFRWNRWRFYVSSWICLFFSWRN